MCVCKILIKGITLYEFKLVSVMESLYSVFQNF